MLRRARPYPIRAGPAFPKLSVFQKPRRGARRTLLALVKMSAPVPFKHGTAAPFRPEALDEDRVFFNRPHKGMASPAFPFAEREVYFPGVPCRRLSKRIVREAFVPQRAGYAPDPRERLRPVRGPKREKPGEGIADREGSPCEWIPTARESGRRPSVPRRRTEEKTAPAFGRAQRQAPALLPPHV